ncbi:Fe2+-enterobactin ABC transporter substrate-binding protein [Pseudoalteromonas spongiae]|uniref:Fe2+-enterobactin ABC transporter substrate-binding protein n=1 Tax=Pseudoalteromonas spongiae TaxID=298657 RepID=UPI00110AA72C|nr:Fe2+-enterobactin ABC transporter substrate-binding protein [Pseudoalteromonas spongiae]TMO85470.1 Fe2+-enterobactin ABC transporter substrate-binding protein [Pseudoalteromonas spongiae]
MFLSRCVRLFRCLFIGSLVFGQFCNIVSAAEFPRYFVNADGSTTEIVAKPKRILSTSVTVTGTLLVMDAPVIASAQTATANFFAQWQNIAQAKKVAPLWPAGQVDLEAAFLQQPDLIIVSVNGADSALAHIDELKMIAPVITVDYGVLTWQQLAQQLAQGLGVESQTDAVIQQFERILTQAKNEITIPSGLANIISYNGPGITNPIATVKSAHGQLLASLGFKLEEPNADWHSGTKATGDFVRAEYEKLSQLNGDITFLLRVDSSAVPRVLNDPVLQNLNSIKNKQVYVLGANSFRIDYYSALEVIHQIKRDFATKPL